MKQFRYRAIEVPVEDAYGREHLTIQVQRQVKYFWWSPFWFHDGYDPRVFYDWSSALSHARALGDKEKDRRKKLLQTEPRVGSWWP